MILKEASLLWVLRNLHEIHFLELTWGVVQQHRLDTSFLLFFPLCLCSPISSYLSCLHPLTLLLPTHTALFLPSLLSVEAPLGEFSSRRILQNEKKLLTRRGKTLLGGTKTESNSRYQQLSNTYARRNTHTRIFLVMLQNFLG